MASSTFDIDGTIVGIRTTDRDFASWLDAALGGYRSVTNADPTYSVVIGGREGTVQGFHILYHGTARLIRTIDLEAVARALIDEVASNTLRDRMDAVFVRAAAVQVNGSVALVPPAAVTSMEPSVRSLARSGFRLPVSRWVAIGSDGSLVPRTPLQLPSDIFDTFGDRNDARDERFIPRDPRPVDTIVTNAPDGGTGVGTSPRAVALHRLASATLNLEALGGTALEYLFRAVSGARCIELDRASADAYPTRLARAILGLELSAG